MNAKVEAAQNVVIDATVATAASVTRKVKKVVWVAKVTAITPVVLLRSQD